MRRALVSIVIAACSGDAVAPPTMPSRIAAASRESPSAAPRDAAPEDISVPAASVPSRFAISESDLRGRCPGFALRFDAGAEVELLCPDDLPGRALTPLDLDDRWTPTLFSPVDGQEPGFRGRYLALAAGDSQDPDERLVELFGVVPALAQVHDRLADGERHACHARIDSTPIAHVDRAYSREHEALVRSADLEREALADRLARERDARRLTDTASLAGVPEVASTYDAWRRLDAIHRGLVAVQRHLACEGLLSANEASGGMSARVAIAIGLYQRRHFLMPHEHLDTETLETLQRDSRELDFRLALRVLRERVADAAGLIEDGTAGPGPLPILGRLLDPEAMRAARGNTEPLPDAAPDLVAVATESAARQLGWTSPDEVQAFLRQHRTGVRVALALPAPPAYHAAHMALEAELDRGDVWYDETPVARRVSRRPTLVVYVDDNGTKRALTRWPTTIGGWSDVQTARGVVERRWKESTVGPHVWRKLYAAPTWIPPSTTPDRDLVKSVGNGTWRLQREILGPGPRGAFGLVLLVHERLGGRTGALPIDGGGIATHGSASVVSIIDGTSHGCHRLYNHLAIRLANFLLQHRTHVIRGDQHARYRRHIAYRGPFVAQLDTRGFLYELDPPVPVRVLAGRIRSARKVPPRASAPAGPD
ncbi:MAG: L,D-transpeptidase family protein [Kofleriaceae bacterium]